jgi:hypothetical protein
MPLVLTQGYVKEREKALEYGIFVIEYKRICPYAERVTLQNKNGWG